MSEIETALAVAVRHLDDATTTEREREAVLAAVAVTFAGEPGETASRSLHHLREQRRLQLTLKNILEAPRA